MVVIIRSEPDKGEENNTKQAELNHPLVRFDFMPKSVSREEVEKFIADSFPESNEMETELISDRINRLAPLYLAATVLADMKKHGIDATEKNFISEFGSIGREYRKASEN